MRLAAVADVELDRRMGRSASAETAPRASPSASSPSSAVTSTGSAASRRPVTASTTAPTVGRGVGDRALDEPDPVALADVDAVDARAAHGARHLGARDGCGRGGPWRRRCARPARRGRRRPAPPGRPGSTAPRPRGSRRRRRPPPPGRRRARSPLHGSTTAPSAPSARRACTMSPVDGFIVWPPVMIRRAPRLSAIARLPSPCSTITTSVARCSTATGARRCVRSTICPCMSAHLDRGDGAHRRRQRQGAAGVVGVDVHLGRVGVADHDQRVADRRQRRLQIGRHDGGAGDHVARAVAVRRGLGVVVGHHGQQRCGRDGRLLAVQAGERAADDLEQARATRVDDARVAQHGQQLGRARDRVLAGGEHRGAQLAPAGGGLGGRRHLADHGQDRALDRLAHRAVRGVGRSPQRRSRATPRTRREPWRARRRARARSATG